MTVSLDGLSDLTFDMTTPGGEGELELSTVRVGRHGGADSADLRYRTRRFGCIGAITVAGGHVEAAHERLVILLDREKTRSSDVGLPWSEPERRFAVHAPWWLCADRPGLRSRFHQRGEDAQIVSTSEELEVQADTLFRYAALLDELLDEDWPRAVLPRRSPEAWRPSYLSRSCAGGRRARTGQGADAARAAAITRSRSRSTP